MQAAEDMMANLVLRCNICGWVPPLGMTIDEVYSQHFEPQADHPSGEDNIQMELMPLCKCGKGMYIDYTLGTEDHFKCLSCRRTTMVRRNREQT